MEALLSFGESLVILIVGLAARFALALAVLALLVVPILIVFEGVRGYRRVHDRVLGLDKVGRVPWASGLMYAAGHTWLRDMGQTTLRIGVDGFFRLLFPHMDTIRVAAPGTVVRRGQALAEVGYGGRRATVPSPVDGTVLALNPALSRRPDLATRDPYRRGWLATIAPLTQEYTNYRTGHSAQAWLAEEDSRLDRFMEQQLGVAVADGGEFVRPPLTLLSHEQWKTLNREFLGTDPPRDSE